MANRITGKEVMDEQGFYNALFDKTSFNQFIISIDVNQRIPYNKAGHVTNVRLHGTAHYVRTICYTRRQYVIDFKPADGIGEWLQILREVMTKKHKVEPWELDADPEHGDRFREHYRQTVSGMQANLMLSALRDTLLTSRAASCTWREEEITETQWNKERGTPEPKTAPDKGKAALSAVAQATQAIANMGGSVAGFKTAVDAFGNAIVASTPTGHKMKYNTATGLWERAKDEDAADAVAFAVAGVESMTPQGQSKKTPEAFAQAVARTHGPEFDALPYNSPGGGDCKATRFYDAMLLAPGDKERNEIIARSRDELNKSQRRDSTKTRNGIPSGGRKIRITEG